MNRSLTVAFGRAIGLIVFVCGATYAQDASFNTNVLPVLTARCLGCHKGAGAQAGLDLTTPEKLLKGGRSGPAIVTGDSSRSLLIAKIVSKSMPPAGPKLTDAEVQTIRSWIDTQSAGPAQTVAITERDVLPIFQMRCVVCHGKRKQEGGLDLRTAASRLKGGRSGPAIVAGKPDESLIVKRITAGEMPPPKLLFANSVRPATDAELETIRKWISAGAPPEPPQALDAAENDGPRMEKSRQFWSFQAPKRPAVPSVRNAGRVRNPIDSFLLQKLEEKNLSFSADASPATLLRRLYIDVIGMPPTPEQLQEFLNDRRPDAWDRQVDKLLASPQYGERWGMYWLDAVGYADSEGKVEADEIRHHAWRYRDYVIRSLNQNKPYNQFLAEQIAGDEMVSYKDGSPVSSDALEKLVATGFWRMAPDGTYSPPQSFLPERMNVVADQIEIFGSAVLGLTINCARCHDHKYDPLPQRDYYRFSAILQTAYDPYDWIIPTKRNLDVFVDSERKEVEAHNAPIEAQIAKLEASLEAIRKPLRQKLLEDRLASAPESVRADLRALVDVDPSKRTELQQYLADKFKNIVSVTPEELAASFPGFRADLERINKQIGPLKEKLWEKPQVRALYEMGGEASATYLLRRGDALSPGTPVGPGVPTVLSNGLQAYRIKGAENTGRRLALAEWIGQPNHPLTARVIVNRMWMHHFGRGIVHSVSNFGKTGTPPTHPELLDWLATELAAKGWSLKAVHRLILTSSAWRQTSAIGAEAGARDPENILLSRMPMQRLDADALHDSILKVTGRLDATMFGRPAPINIKPDGEVVQRGAETGSRRSIYVLRRRRSPVTMLEVFDTPPMSPNCVERPKSTVPTQALQLMNSAEILEHARYLAGRLLDHYGTASNATIDAVYRRIFARAPSPAEVKAGVDAVARFREDWRGHLKAKNQAAPVGSTAEWMALGDFIHALLSSSEFSYVD